MGKRKGKARRKNNQGGNNPFESRQQRSKFNVMNKSTKGTKVNIVKARSDAHQKRENTLGIELKRKNKDNVFDDRRFTREEENMPHEEKMLLLFQRERQRQFNETSDNLYSLGTETSLTHRGKNIGKKVKEGILDLDDDFGGFEKVDPEKSKTREEVMKDVIAKSKYYRALRAEEKEEGFEKMQQLDEELNDIKNLLSIKPTKVKRTGEKKLDEFDQLALELESEARGRPSQPLQTPEAVAQAEMERLQQLERQRIERMLGEDEQEPEKTIGGDDLFDDYNIDYKPNKNKKRGKLQSKKKDIKAVPLSATEEITSLGPEEEIPFTIVMPSSYANFTSLIDDQSPRRQDTIIKRIRACHHLSLSPGNRDKLKVFLQYLMRRIFSLGKVFPFPQDPLNVLIYHIFQLCHQMPEFSANVAKEHISKLQERNKEVVRMPPVSGLIFLIAISHIWPVSDKRHVVITPVMLYMANCLFKAEITSINDVLKGLMLTDIFLNYLTPAQRYSAEPMNFLTRVIFSCLGKDIKEHPLFCNLISTSIDTSILKIETWGKFKATPLPIKVEEVSDDLKFNILNTAVNTLDKYTNIYQDEERVAGYLDVLNSVKVIHKELLNIETLPRVLKTTLNRTSNKLKKRFKVAHSVLKPLQLHKKKIVGLPLYTPDYMTEYQPNAAKTKDKREREVKRLKKEFKQEYKGAERELKADAVFIARKKRKREAEIDEEKTAYTKKVYSFLEEQQRDEKIVQKVKRRKIL
eukprot:TRINITY_DN10828_c0_g1_i1.p1 TRINITY_DN10828_c0_g1~~TRINITY_DN10828_c0_g1_i1.p1  ORF type:complete len:748 (+),score=183.65 TRINITY_DN10828_c0_g1_i1:13-2256(+)